MTVTERKVMVTEPTTLYKLMVLYMLKKVNFPLANSQMTDFFVGKEYTSYFTFQGVVKELEEANLIRSRTIRNITSYEMTGEGEDALYFFNNNLSASIKEDIDKYLSEHRIQFRSEASTVADYYKSSANQEYTVHCEIKEGKATLFSMNLSVPTQEQAERVCGKWQEENQRIYAMVMQSLL